MVAAALKIVEPEFDDGDGGGPFAGWSNADIINWLLNSIDLAEGDTMWERVHAEMKRRGLKLS
jgi:hypothetical protein